MELSKIISISGRSGLFKIVGEMKNGVVVESLEDGKRIPALSSQQVSTLEDISIYTTEEDLPLGDVLTKMKEKLEDKEAPDPKTDPEELKKFFTEMLPEYDKERVYVSDIKKVVRWYNALKKANLLIEEEKEEEKADKEETDKKAEGAEDTPAKKAEGAEDTPAKKAEGAEDTTAKKAEGAKDTPAKKAKKKPATPKETTAKKAVKKPKEGVAAAKPKAAKKPKEDKAADTDTTKK